MDNSCWYCWVNPTPSIGTVLGARYRGSPFSVLRSDNCWHGVRQAALKGYKFAKSEINYAYNTHNINACAAVCRCICVYFYFYFLLFTFAEELEEPSLARLESVAQRPLGVQKLQKQKVDWAEGVSQKRWLGPINVSSCSEGSQRNSRLTQPVDSWRHIFGRDDDDDHDASSLFLSPVSVYGCQLPCIRMGIGNGVWEWVWVWGMAMALAIWLYGNGKAIYRSL